MFLTTQDIDEPEGAFWSDDFWTGFLAMMARNRYNFLDIHGPCDAVTLDFPNGFSYFVSLPDFPEVGVGPDRAARNMARFQQIISMATRHGIKVGYMNYVASPPIGPWKTRRFGKDQRWVPVPQKFLRGSLVAQYTRQAVTAFLKGVPDLWMFGFRIGESGQPEDFYNTAYLEALKEFPKTLNIYVRTWLADPQKVRALANSTAHPLYIEIKYNGEQLGLPYQTVLGGREYPPKRLPRGLHRLSSQLFHHLANSRSRHASCLRLGLAGICTQNCVQLPLWRWRGIFHGADGCLLPGS